MSRDRESDFRLAQEAGSHPVKDVRRFATKNLGDAHRVPIVALLQVLNAFCCFSSLLSFWLPWFYSPFPFFMESCNDLLSQLFDCIESACSEVKEKMSDASVVHRCTKVTSRIPRAKSSRLDHEGARELSAIRICRNSASNLPALCRLEFDCLAFASWGCRPPSIIEQ